MIPLEDRMTPQRRPMRFVAFGLAALIGVSALTVRLAYMQLVNGGQYVAGPDANRVVQEAVPSTRGLIYDRAGRLLVTNVPSFAVKLRPADLPTSLRPEVVTRLSGLLGMSTTEINSALDANPGARFDLVRIANDVPEATARLISEEAHDLPGVRVVVESHRQYTSGTLFSQILGYTGPVSPEQLATLKDKGYLPDDAIGKNGVEASYESYLRGTYGLEKVERDASGREIQVLSTVKNAQAGASLQLTIDTREQKLAQQAIQWGIDTAHLESGVLIVMNPQTGEVLAMVSLPTYDNNLFATGISNTDYQSLLKESGRPLVNHAISDQYPPGSTYKLVTGTGGLGDGKLTEHSTLVTKAYLSLGPFKYYDWNRAGWGPIDIKLGFGHSSDTFFYQVAGLLGIDRLGYWANQFGFGAPTGIDLPGEAKGIVPTNQWKEDTFGAPVYPGETYQAGIGQGYDVSTPIQLINAYTALANGGRLYQPQVVREVIGADGNVVRPFKPKLIHELDVSADTLRIMREAARTVVTIRHTYNLVELPIKVAGKSGTAEFGTRDAQGRLPFHSWFVGFTPKDPVAGSFDNPDSQLVVLAFANNSRTVGNAATEIVKYFMQLHYGIDKDYRLPQLLARGNFYGD
ncbi:MAG: penicillin-binding protein 2 [Candidatus Limnocylindrales bacterium]